MTRNQSLTLTLCDIKFVCRVPKGSLFESKISLPSGCFMASGHLFYVISVLCDADDSDKKFPPLSDDNSRKQNSTRLQCQKWMISPLKHAGLWLILLRDSFKIKHRIKFKIFHIEMKCKPHRTFADWITIESTNLKPNINIKISRVQNQTRVDYVFTYISFISEIITESVDSIYS